MHNTMIALTELLPELTPNVPARIPLPSADDLIRTSAQITVDQSFVEAVIDALSMTQPEHDRARQTIMMSPTLTLHVLRAAHEETGGRIPLSIETACSVLGHVKLRELCEQLPLAPEADDERRSFIRHCAEVASIAKGIAGAFCPTMQNEAYLAGLLHDIGRPLLLLATDDAFGDGAHLDDPQQLAERKTFVQANHVFAGAAIMRRSNVPIPVARAVESHHQDGPPSSMFEMCVWAAEVITAGTRSAHGRMRAIATGEHLGLRAGDVRLMLLLGSAGSDLGQGARVRRAEENPLAPRQRQMMQLLATGCRPAKIARTLGLSESTVSNTLSQIYRKLGVTSGVQAALMCDRQGWL